MEYRLASVAQEVKASAVREILKLTQSNSVISFAGGLPAEELFPVAALQQAFDRVFRQGAHTLQYGLTEGFTPLRETIALRMASKGMPVEIDSMLLTTGSQQAIDLIARVLIEPGDCILVENPTYLAALQIFKFHSAVILPIPADQNGMDMSVLEQTIRIHRPKFVYVTPTFSNPTGKVWSLERRKQLISLCREYNVLIVEDDPYGDIVFNGEPPISTIYALDTRDGEGDAVVYTSTFSKTVVPALRTGWVLGSRRVIHALTRAKQAADLHSSSLDQQAVYQLLQHFDLDGHIATIRAEYSRRMLILHGLLLQQPWNDVYWNKPEGGMFLWLTLPEHMDAEALLQVAIAEGVAFVPGVEFYAQAPERNTVRLNFSHSSPQALEEGVARLAKAFTLYSTR